VAFLHSSFDDWAAMVLQSDVTAGVPNLRTRTQRISGRTGRKIVKDDYNNLINLLERLPTAVAC
jgi:hypothetical protein